QHGSTSSFDRGTSHRHVVLRLWRSHPGSRYRQSSGTSTLPEMQLQTSSSHLLVQRLRCEHSPQEARQAVVGRERAEDSDENAAFSGPCHCVWKESCSRPIRLWDRTANCREGSVEDARER